MPSVRTGILVALMLGVAVQGLAADPIDERARRLEEKLIAPCCFTQQVSQHDSEAAREVKADIRARLGAGQSDDEIVQAYVAQYGTRILSEPPMRGTNLLLLVVPGVLLVLATWWLARLIRRFTAHPALADVPAEPTPAALSARLEEELRDMD